jgi:outer membrane receptor protein involved in Fe transport
MLQYISGDWDSYGMGENEQKNYGATISGAVPGMDKLSFAAGYEYREDSGSTTNDGLILQGITTAGSSLNTIGSYEVDDLFVELLYVTGDLEVSVASRYSDYSTFGDTTNSEIGVQYQVNDMVGLRGTFSEAFRAPSVPDLYGGTSLGYPTADDACDDNTASGGQATASCQANGVPATGFVSSIVQIPTLYGGNPNLQPETSESWTVGAVIDPIDGLTMTIDYWSIEIDNAVGTVGTTDLIRLCASQGLYCDRTFRFSSPASVEGQIIRVEDTNNNVGTETYTGVDLGISADLPSVAGGDLTMDMQATYNEETQVVTAGGLVVEDLAGTVSQTYGMYARWRALTKVNWNKGAINVSYTNRYIHGTTDEVDDFWTTGPVYTEIPEVMYNDITVSYTTDSMGTVALGITNFTDEEVPFVPSAFNANTDQENYDLFGPVINLRYNYTF